MGGGIAAADPVHDLFALALTPVGRDGE